jgi:hydrogenase-4 component B
MEVPREVLSPGFLVILASLLAAASGLPLVFRILSLRSGQRFSAAAMTVAAALASAGAAWHLASGGEERYSLAWNLPFGPCEIALDPLSALFLFPIFVVPACGAVYALGYWPAEEHPGNVRKLSFFYGLLCASMAWVTLARGAVPFLVGWEVMALSAYFVLTTEDGKEEVREAGTLYMITTHTATLALFGCFSLLRAETGSFLFPAAGSLSPWGAAATAVFLTALLGFGIKAGLMPLHVWLPSAHATAPSHVSAVMSGVILKVGIYGLLRLLSFYSTAPLWWGVAVLALGTVSAVAGVAFAIAQHDLKRLLAYHSIENVGIIAMGIGTALVGRATGNGALVLLGAAGALLHVANHATFKALLFLGAGSVIHRAGTREIDRMGGLAKELPRTAAAFLVGAVAICGLPPLNGFVSEFLVYLGLFRGAVGGEGSAAAVTAVAVPSLALVGGLASACFVKVYGVVFLGESRSAGEGGGGHGAAGEGRPMTAPMAFLALVCVAVGLLPFAAAAPLERVVHSFDAAAAGGGEGLSALAPLGWLAAANLALLLLLAPLAILYLRRRSRFSPATDRTWGCGYLAPTARMQYTASSFADGIVWLFRGILRPSEHRPFVSGLAPRVARYSSHVPEAVLERVYVPALKGANERVKGIRALQGGKVQHYILYILVTLAALLSWPG